MSTEVSCDKCGGRGEVFENNPYYPDHFLLDTCPRCRGRCHVQLGDSVAFLRTLAVVNEIATVAMTAAIQAIENYSIKKGRN